jgi:Family of unknown function (DUF5519)
MSVSGASEKLREIVSSWPGVESRAHRFGGVEYRLGSREIGHVHGDFLVDIPFPKRVRDELVAAGAAAPRRITFSPRPAGSASTFAMSQTFSAPQRYYSSPMTLRSARFGGSLNPRPTVQCRVPLLPSRIPARSRVRQATRRPWQPAIQNSPRSSCLRTEPRNRGVAHLPLLQLL